MTFNFHTHTYRCNHAGGSEREYIETAISRGIKQLGFADHSPQIFPGNYVSGFRMLPDQVEDYFSTIRKLAEEYKNDIKIYVGFEAEYYPLLFDKFLEFIKPYNPDYLILGQHFIDNEYDTSRASGGRNDEKALCDYVNQTLEALKTGKFTYFAHPDMFRYTDDDEIYEKHIRRLCKGVKELDIPLEVNMLGLRENRHYPKEQFWRIAVEEGNKIVLGCDAHSPEFIADELSLEKARAYAEKLGIIYIDELTLRKI